MRAVMTVAVAVALTTAAWLTREVQANRLVWDHFDVVKPGILYRGGQLNPDQVAQAARRYGIKLIISFQYPGRGVDAERALCKSLGVEFLNLPMPGDGFGREDQFREVLAATADPARRPVFIHCARGTCRTGSAVALYRFEKDGWTPEDVSAEMRRQAYREGWLTGYVYNMIDSKPTDGRFAPAPAPARVASHGGARDER